VKRWFCRHQAAILALVSCGVVRDRSIFRARFAPEGGLSTVVAEFPLQGQQEISRREEATQKLKDS